MAEALLQADRLVARYGDALALDHVGLEIAKGETLALVGPSGSGKSTLARALLRLHPLESGAIRFEGEDWLALQGAVLRRRRARMQMVFQDPLSAFNPAPVSAIFCMNRCAFTASNAISQICWKRSGLIRRLRGVGCTKFPAASDSAWQLPARLRHPLH